MRAIHDDDLETVLRGLGIFEDLIRGRSNCHICQGEVSLSGIGCIFALNGEICVCCSRPACCAAAVCRRGDE